MATEDGSASAPQRNGQSRPAGLPDPQARHKRRIEFGGWKTALGALVLLSVVWGAVSGLFVFSLGAQVAVFFAAALLVGATLLRVPRVVAREHAWLYYVTALIYLPFGTLSFLAFVGGSYTLFFGHVPYGAELKQMSAVAAAGLLSLALLAVAARFVRRSLAASGRWGRTDAVALLVGFAIAGPWAILTLTAGLADLYPFRYTSLSVDIRSGRLQRVHPFLGLPAGYDVIETPVSEAITEELPADLEPDWRAVYVHRAFTHTHTAFHGAASQIHEMDLAWQVDEYPPEVRRKMARDLIYFWQRAGRDSLADHYLHAAIDELLRSGDESFRDACLIELLDTPPEKMLGPDGKFNWKPGASVPAR